GPYWDLGAVRSDRRSDGVVWWCWPEGQACIQRGIRGLHARLAGSRLRAASGKQPDSYERSRRSTLEGLSRWDVVWGGRGGTVVERSQKRPEGCRQPAVRYTCSFVSCRAKERSAVSSVSACNGTASTSGSELVWRVGGLMVYSAVPTLLIAGLFRLMVAVRSGGRRSRRG